MKLTSDDRLNFRLACLFCAYNRGYWLEPRSGSFLLLNMTINILWSIIDRHLYLLLFLHVLRDIIICFLVYFLRIQWWPIVHSCSRLQVKIHVRRSLILNTRTAKPVTPYRTQFKLISYHSARKREIHYDLSWPEPTSQLIKKIISITLLVVTLHAS